MYWKEQQALTTIQTMHDLYDNITCACSFGKDSIVVTHLCLQICPNFPIFFINTPFKPQETLTYRDIIVKQWHLNYTEYISKEKVDWRLHLNDPDLCCQRLKVEPTKEALQNMDVWITGLRQDEGNSRANYKIIEHKNGLVKVNPILHWTEEEAMDIGKIPATLEMLLPEK